MLLLKLKSELSYSSFAGTFSVSENSKRHTFSPHQWPRSSRNYDHDFIVVMNDPLSEIVVLLPTTWLSFKAQYALTDTVTSLRKSESRRLCTFLECCAKRCSRGIEASKRWLSIVNTLMFKGE